VHGFWVGRGKEGVVGWRWAKRLDGLGAMVGFVMKNLEEKKVNGWAAKDTGAN
jgi:hypothetical protein